MNTTARVEQQDTSNLLVPDARDIANALLSRTGAALMSGDVNSFAECFHLPTTIETFEGQNVLKDFQDLKTVFEGVRRHLIRKSVTEMIRNILSADFDGEATVHTTHETRLMNGNRLVQEPYPCFSVVRRFGNDWKAISSSYAIVNEPRHVNTLLGKTYHTRSEASSY